jgi:hypothetical protein
MQDVCALYTLWAGADPRGALRSRDPSNCWAANLITDEGATSVGRYRSTANEQKKIHDFLLTESETPIQNSWIRPCVCVCMYVYMYTCVSFSLSLSPSI